VYWREGGTYQVLWCSDNGLVYRFGSRGTATGLDTPNMYTVEFTSTVGAMVKATYSEGPNPLEEAVVTPDEKEFKVPGWFTPPYSTTAGGATNLGPIYASPGATTSVRRLPLVEIQMAKRSPVVTSEAELRVPTDRTRRRVGVEENITLSAADADGDVHWSIVAGHGNGKLSATTGATVTYTTHEFTEVATVEAKDNRSRALVQFEVLCNYAISPARLGRIFTSASATRLVELAEAFNESYELFDMTTCQRRAHFFAQALKEAGPGAEPVPENLNYSVAGLSIFGYFQGHPAEAQQFGYIKDPKTHKYIQRANQQEIANRAYALRNGNGDVATGDGWTFRGRGYIQVTGRANYGEVQRELNARFPNSGIDIVANQDDAITPRGGIVSAMAFWSRHKLNRLADMGATAAEVVRISAVVNANEDPAARVANFTNVTSVAFRLAQLTPANCKP